MCGIVGIVSAPGEAPPRPEGVERLCHRLAHRGPDDQGVQVLGQVGLGHQRLSIIDLSPGGRQPMASPSGRSWIVFNGEIYNYRELRSEYEQRGVRFLTHSDTEVILAGFELDGAAVWRRLKGMWGLALYDSATRELWLVRDPIGIKPLCYRWAPREFAFASEIKALVNLDATPPVSPSALATYLARQYVPAPATIFEGVSRLPAGSWIRFRVSSDAAWRRPPRPERYWRAEETALDGTPGLDDVERTVTAATARHLVSDVPVGTFLSGGIDSGLVSAYATQACATRLTSFSIGFDSAAYDERPLARRTAQRLGVQHVEHVVSIDDWDLLPKLAWVFDEPLGDPSILPTYLVCRAARSGRKVVLSGDGGDEVFGGYDSYRHHLTGRHWSQRLGPVGGLVGQLARKSYDRGMRGAAHLLFLGDPRQADAQLHTGYFTREALARLAPELPAPNPLPEISTLDGARSPLVRLQLIDMLTYLPEAMLMKVDRASMAHGLEVRVPLLDTDVVRVGLALPDRLKVNGGQGKVALRQLARRRLPTSVAEGPKRGFGLPLEQWFRGSLSDIYTEVVLAPDARVRSVFAKGALERLLAQHQRPGFNLGPRLWAVLVLEFWARAYRAIL